MVNTAFKKLKVGESNLLDKRGKSKNRPRANDGKTESAIEHIDMFPRMESHYVRSESKREYLEEGLNLTRMYSLYVEWAKENKKKSPVNTTTAILLTLNLILDFSDLKKINAINVKVI